MHAGEVRRYVRCLVGARIGDFVEKLLLHRHQVDDAAAVLGLGDHEAPVSFDLDKGKAELGEARHVLDARIGVVAAGDLAAALEQVPHHRAGGKAVPVARIPAECVHGGREKQRGIGDAPGKDDVGTGFQRGQQCLGAEIGIGRDEPGVIGDASAGLQDAVVRLEQSKHVVAGHRRHLERDAAALCDRQHGCRAGHGVGRAHVGKQTHALPLRHRQQALHASRKERVVAVVRILQLAQLRQRDGALGEALEAEVGEPGTLGEHHRRLEPVARESGPRTDTDHANSFSCSARHWILPEPERGSASTNSTRRGAL